MLTANTPVTLPFGKHTGLLVTHAPEDYLRWLAKKAEFIMEGIDWVPIAEAELERRGTNYEGILPSHHAIDRFSQRHLDKFIARDNQAEGLSSFVSRVALTAWEAGELVNFEETPGMLTVTKEFGGMGFVFACTTDENPKPVAIKTVLVV